MTGVYKPVGVLRAMAMSACGRMVRDGLPPPFVLPGVMEERSTGHAIMALASVFSNMGRYVRRVNWALSGTGGGDGAGCKADALTESGDDVEGSKCSGIWAFRVGRREWRDVRSREVE
jgi:hypothetical protein